MGIFDIFSKRQKALRGELPDVYTYDVIPETLKVQVIQVLRDALGDHSEYNENFRGTRRAYELIVNALCREYGVFVLPGTKDRAYGGGYDSELEKFLLQERDPEKSLDAIELSFRCIDSLTRRWDYLHRNNAGECADDAIEELNERFREHGVGYQFEGGELIRVDSTFLHVEAVKPALAVLKETEYKGAQAEFLTAHEHYPHGRRKEANPNAFQQPLDTAILD